MKYKLIDANEKDGIEMLNLIEGISSKGLLELLYTRRPNAYLSYKMESDNSIIKLIKDKEKKIIFQGAAVINEYFLEGKKEKVAYVGGFRKDPNVKENLHWIELFGSIDKELPVDRYYCSILNENKHAKDVFTKRRSYWPDFEELCNYKTYIFNPKVVRKKNWNNNKYVFRQVEEKDLDKVYKYLEKEGKKYNFFPCISDLRKLCNLELKDCYILLDKDEIVAFTALWNQAPFKQYVVKKYNFPLNIMKKFSFITEKIGYIPFPKENQTFSFYHLSFFLVKGNDINIYKAFLKEICNIYDSSLVIGINNEVIKEKIYESIRCLSFESTIYYINFKKNKTDFKKEFYIECALL